MQFDSATILVLMVASDFTSIAKDDHKNAVSMHSKR